MHVLGAWVWAYVQERRRRRCGEAAGQRWHGGRRTVEADEGPLRRCQRKREGLAVVPRATEGVRGAHRASGCRSIERPHSFLSGVHAAQVWIIEEATGECGAVRRPAPRVARVAGIRRPKTEPAKAHDPDGQHIASAGLEQAGWDGVRARRVVHADAERATGDDSTACSRRGSDELTVEVRLVSAGYDAEAEH